jgi:aspartyl-tRNA(Asn)/glutamyl-tRNA(Gln) amidotransferase subunit B
MPELPRVREERFVEQFAFKRNVAAALTAERETADYFEALIEAGIDAKLAANWTREEALRLAGIHHKPLVEVAPVAKMAELIRLVDEGKVARVVAKGECDELFAGDEPPTAYFTERGMIQEADSGQLEGWVATACEANPAVVADVTSGKMAAVGRLIGETMKLSGGKANPKDVRPAILKHLGVS